MRSLACPHCRALVFFENVQCVTCGTQLGFVRDRREFVDVEAALAGGALRPCRNNELALCNWLADSAAPDGLCSACHLTRTRPHDTDAVGLLAFARTEQAKKRLVYTLDDLGLPTTPRSADPDHGLAFDLLASDWKKVLTGHDRGVITIDLAEGDDSHREQMRNQLDEPYRTLLGHLRHETGHWYWEVLVENRPVVEDFRELFGDERRDYAESLAEHYGRPDDRSWAKTHVSHYAASHPWEDWAETFAHYLHLRDTIQTAADWGVRVAGPDLNLNLAPDAPVSAQPRKGEDDFDELISTWTPLTFALNSLNRSMGHADLYPFVLSPIVLTKLRFVHQRVVADSRAVADSRVVTR